MLWALIIAAIVALDRITKYLVIKNIEYGEMIPIINNFFFLTYHENKGAAWGILQNMRYLFIITTLIISAGLIYYIVKTSNRFLKISLAFILGGAIGNLIDRVWKGSVADFLDFHIGEFHFPTFNFADTFITIGTILLSYYLLFMDMKQSCQ